MPFNMFEKNYQRGLWSKDMMRKLIVRGKLTETEDETIVGEPAGELPVVNSTIDEKVANLEGVVDTMLGGE